MSPFWSNNSGWVVRRPVRSWRFEESRTRPLALKPNLIIWKAWTKKIENNATKAIGKRKLNINSTLTLSHRYIGGLDQHIDNTCGQNCRDSNEGKDGSGIVAHNRLSCKETLRDLAAARGDPLIQLDQGGVVQQELKTTVNAAGGYRPSHTSRKRNRYYYLVMGMTRRPWGPWGRGSFFMRVIALSTSTGSSDQGSALQQRKKDPTSWEKPRKFQPIQTISWSRPSLDLQSSLYLARSGGRLLRNGWRTRGTIFKRPSKNPQIAPADNSALDRWARMRWHGLVHRERCPLPLQLPDRQQSSPNCWSRPGPQQKRALEGITRTTGGKRKEKSASRNHWPHSSLLFQNSPTQISCSTKKK